MADNMGEVFTVIRYHVWWPGSGDPFWLYNQPEVQTRNSYYGNNYAPHGFFDGAIDGEYYYNAWEGIVDNRSLVFSILRMNITGNFDEGTGTGQFTVSIYAEETPGLSNLRLRTALVESNISYGGRTWNQIFRDMIPSTYGESITISQSETLEFTYDFTVSYPLVPRNCQLVVFVQSDQNREILQSTREWVIELQTSVDEEIATPTEFNLSQNYPNPFNAATRIDFRTEADEVSLAVYDVTGSLVKTLLDGSLEAGSHSVVWDGKDNSGSDVSSGIYFYRLSDSSGNNVRRMTLLK
ncbi:MAG: Omp28-related outer membrane protein [Candidatus Zixiibacteriota bacterium]|nr:MAG: Omp28-related outer membrane protein [candidate division Zixibacteria bacterium]